MFQMEVVGRKDRERFDEMLGEYHYLGEARPSGDFLRQVAVEDGRRVGLLAHCVGGCQLEARLQTHQQAHALIHSSLAAPSSRNPIPKRKSLVLQACNSSIP